MFTLYIANKNYSSWSLHAWVTMLLFLFISGCANVHYEHGSTQLGDDVLVFGKITLVRDGEQKPLNTGGNQTTLRNITTDGKPLLVTERCDASGRFYWKLKPGKYELDINLNPASHETVSFIFDAATPSQAYYFGDVVFSGNKTYTALNAPNIVNVKVSIDDDFDTAREEVVGRNSSLSGHVERLKVVDITKTADRLAYFQKEIDLAKSCCPSLAGLQFQELKVGSASTVKIGRDDRVFDFPSGRSPYVAFLLPQQAGSYKITIRSISMERGVPWHYQLFVPAAMLLDERHAIIRTLETGYLTPVPAFIVAPLRGPALHGEIHVEPSNVHARYLVLFTTPGLLEGRYLAMTSETLSFASSLMDGSMSPAMFMDPWMSGELEVILQKEDE
jgi:hypothetical protein